MTCSSAPAAGTHWPKSRLVQMKYCCRNAPLARPNSPWSIILHWPKTSSSPFDVNDPVSPHLTLIVDIIFSNALKRLPLGFFNRVSSSNTTPSKLDKSFSLSRLS